MKVQNPFKFGTIANVPCFTNRKEELHQMASMLNSQNHLVIISPRRFGKTSLVHQALLQDTRPRIMLDLQIATGIADLASQLLKRGYAVYPMQKIKQYIKQFKVIPGISLNPVTNAVEITFTPESSGMPALDDVLNLIEKLGSPHKRTIVVLDEFQEIHQLDRQLAPMMRSVMQHHKHINYILMGSHESMMREIFEQKKSPFYHFGLVMNLGKIPAPEFGEYVAKGLKHFTDQATILANQILDITDCHPYYTQQLGWFVWEVLNHHPTHQDPVRAAIENIENMHDMDYERLWNTLNKTDQKVMLGLIREESSLLSGKTLSKYGIGATSTAFSAIKRLIHKGYIIKTGQGYTPDDPLFAGWLLKKRNEG